MVTQTTPEKPKSDKIIFTREELLKRVRKEILDEKRTQEKDPVECDTRLAKLEATIRDEMQQNEQVSMTSVELQKFINQENFPPEEAHMFLRERKEITSKAEKEQKSLLSTMTEEGKKVIGKTKELVEGGIDWAKEKIDEYKNMSWADRAFLSLKLWIGGAVLSLGAMFGVKGAKEALELIKKEKKLMAAYKKDPKAALEEF